MSSAYMRNLRADPQFQQVLKWLREQRPQPLAYDAKTDNVREVIYGLARAEGFDLAVKHLESM